MSIEFVIVCAVFFGCVTAIMASKKGLPVLPVWFFLGAVLGVFGPLLVWWQDDTKADK